MHHVSGHTDECDTCSLSCSFIQFYLSSCLWLTGKVRRENRKRYDGDDDETNFATPKTQHADKGFCFTLKRKQNTPAPAAPKLLPRKVLSVDDQDGSSPTSRMLLLLIHVSSIRHSLCRVTLRQHLVEGPQVVLGLGRRRSSVIRLSTPCQPRKTPIIREVHLNS